MILPTAQTENEHCRLLLQKIVPFYQPIIDVSTMKIYGAEVLMRIEGDEACAAEEIISALEMQGLLGEATRILLNRVAADLNHMHSVLAPGMYISFNVTPAQFETAGFLYDTLKFLSLLPLDKFSLAVEITEHSRILREDIFSLTLSRLKMANVAVLIDDFGRACSNLEYLERFGFSGIKIDRLFVGALNTETPSESLIPLIYEMADRKKLSVIVEGVETSQQSQALAGMGGTIQQGYFFSPPLSQDQLYDFIKNF